MAAQKSRIGRDRTRMADVTDFLGQRRFAMVGLSRNAPDYTRLVMREFLARGYEPVPVNPNASEIEGRACFARVEDMQPPVAAALLFTAASVTEDVVHECAAAGIRQIWIRRSPLEPSIGRAAAFCREHGISVIAGECPLMFLPQTAFFHRLHGWCNKVVGRYPN